MLTILYNISEQIEAEWIISNSIYEAGIILILKLDKDILRKESYLSIFLMHIHAKNLQQILAVQIQQCIRRTPHHDQVLFIAGIQGWLNIQKLSSFTIIV